MCLLLSLKPQLRSCYTSTGGSFWVISSLADTPPSTNAVACFSCKRWIVQRPEGGHDINNQLLTSPAHGVAAQRRKPELLTQRTSHLKGINLLGNAVIRAHYGHCAPHPINRDHPNADRQTIRWRKIGQWMFRNSEVRLHAADLGESVRGQCPGKLTIVHSPKTASRGHDPQTCKWGGITSDARTRPLVGLPDSDVRSLKSEVLGPGLGLLAFLYYTCSTNKQAYCITY